MKAPIAMPAVVWTLALAAAAVAAEAPGLFGPLDDAVAGQRTALGEPADKAAKKTAKTYDKVRKLFASTKAARSLKDEVRTAAKVVRLLERKVPESGLDEEVDDLLDAYDAVIEGHGDDARTLIGFGVLEGAAAVRAAKAADQLDDALAKADAEELASRRAKFLAQAAAKVRKLERVLPPAAGVVEQAWFVRSLDIADGNTGHDFDGDGTADNAFGASLATIEGLTGESLPDFLNPAIEDGSLVLILQGWGIDGWGTADPLAWLGAFQGLDADGDAADNASGSEVFGAPPLTLDGDGHALFRAPTALDAAGRYEWSVDDEFAFDLVGDLELPTVGPLVLAGTAGPSAHTGYLAFPVPAEAAELLLDAILPAEIGGIFSRETVIALALTTLLDLDLDGDGTKDAMSVALSFDAVPCVVEP